MLFGALGYKLLSRWLPEQFFVPPILVVGAIFAVVFGLVWPMELTYREFDDDPDNITPAERVERPHSKVRTGRKAGR